MLLPMSWCALLPLNVNAALSATTVNTIQGTKPYLLLPDGETKLTDLNALLGFTMPKQDGSDGVEQIDASMASKVISAPAGMRYQDISALVAVDGQLHDVKALVGDDDGDALLAENTRVAGQMKATWYNAGKAVSQAELGNSLSACEGPYTLTLSIPTAVSANTTYGDPNNNTYGTHSGLTYTFSPAGRGVCYLQPLDMTVRSGTEGVDTKYVDGYNPDVWVSTGPYASKGFKASAGFPTTGFYKAQFSVIGPGDDQRHYRCRVDSGSWVELSGSAYYSWGQNCIVTYNTKTKPTTPVKIYLDYRVSGGSDWEEIDTYTISVPTKWAIGIGQGVMAFANRDTFAYSTSFPVYDACRTVVDGHANPATTKAQATDMTASGQAWRQKYLYRRDEFTNSPYGNRDKYPENMKGYSGYAFGARDVDGTWYGEWGQLNSYAKSPFAISYPAYWTAEIVDKENGRQYTAWYDGRILGGYRLSQKFTAICRGE